MNSIKFGMFAAGAAFTFAGTVQASPEVYGKVNVSYQYEEQGDDDAWKLQSNASRLGVKGSFPMGTTLEAIYKAEYEIAVDDGDAVFKQRNIYGGVKGNFGSVFAGVHDTPVKVLGKNADMFNDYNLGDIKAVVVGENRMKNTVSYQTPTFGSGFQFWAMFIPGEETGGEDDGPADGISASLTYKSKMFKAGVGYDSDVKGIDTIRASGQAKLGVVTLGALIQTSEASEGDSDRETGIVLSAAAKVSKQDKIKVQVTAGDEQDEGARLISLGWDHKFTKASKFYAFASAYENDSGDAADDMRIGVGIEHKFSTK